MRFLKIFAALGAVSCVFHAQAFGQSISTVSPRTGEISFEGHVLGISKEKQTLELEVVSFTLPNGKSSVLKVQKSKTIFLAGTEFLAGEKPFALESLKVGETVIVIGSDSGTGVPLKARTVWKKGQEKAVEPPIPIVPPKQEVEQPPAILKHEDLLPAPTEMDDLKISVVDLGFDYTTRTVRKAVNWTQRPNYFCIFELSSLKTDEKIDSSRIQIRRVVGPAGQMVGAEELHSVSKVKPQYGFSDSHIDPRWAYVDVDIDISPKNPTGPSSYSSSNFVVDALPIPSPNQEIEVNREVVGGFGTTFKLVKVKRAANSKDMVLVWTHEIAPGVTDVSVPSYSFNFGGNRSGNGGVSFSSKPKAEHELSLSFSEGETTKKLDFTIFEYAPTRISRTGFQRKRFRLPVAPSLQTRPVQSLPTAQLATYSDATVEGIGLTAEKTGLSSSSAGGLLWVKSPLPDAKRRLFWKPVGGKTTFGDGATQSLHFVSTPTYDYYWHGDGTPANVDENAFSFVSDVPKSVKTYDMEIKMEQKLVVESHFAIENISIPAIGTPLKIFEETGENALTLRKILRYSDPKEVPGYLTSGDSPRSGMALVFETSPLITNSQFKSQVLDVEDNTGRSLKIGFDTHRPYFQGDSMIRYDNSKNFFSMLVAIPPDAQSISVWLKAIETANEGKNMTALLPNIPNETYKP